MAQSQKKGMILMVICSMMWSISGVFIKSIPWNPIAISGWRSLFAALVFFFYMRWRRYKLVVNKQTLLCGFMLTATMFLYIFACKMTTSANAIILQSASPIFIMLLGTAFLGHRYRKSEYALVLVVLSGIALFFLDQLTPGGMAGNLLALISGVTLGAMFLMSNRLPDDQSAQSALMLGHIFTLAVGVPASLFIGTPVTVRSAVYIVILGIVQLGIPYVLYGIAVRICTPLTCSLIGMLEPLFNPVWVLLVIGEKPGPWALLGGAVVMISVSAWMLTNAAVATKQQEEAETASDSIDQESQEQTEELV